MGTMHEPHDITNPPPLADPPRLTRVWLRRGLLAVAILMLMTAGVATLAGFNGRQGWRWELLCHFRVQYFWGLAASFALFAFLRHWFLAATAAVLAGVNLCADRTAVLWAQQFAACRWSRAGSVAQCAFSQSQF